MRAIKHALTERWYAYEEARKIAAKDPDLHGMLETQDIDEDPKSLQDEHQRVAEDKEAKAKIEEDRLREPPMFPDSKPEQAPSLPA